jgi:hypothetical protein
VTPLSAYYFPALDMFLITIFSTLERWVCNRPLSIRFMRMFESINNMRAVLSAGKVPRLRIAVPMMCRIAAE